jgi:hypothetical protein
LGLLVELRRTRPKLRLGRGGSKLARKRSVSTPDAKRILAAAAMSNPMRRRPGASTSTAVAPTSSKRDPEEDSIASSEESGDDEVPRDSTLFLARRMNRGTLTGVCLPHRRCPRRRDRRATVTMSGSGSWSARSPTCPSGSCNGLGPTGPSGGLLPPLPRRRRLAGRARRGPA